MSSSSFPISITVLGSGTSQGVPMIGCDCPVCRSTDPRDKRTRCSVYITTPEAALLIDTPPELRLQSLRAGLNRVDAVLITHAHADHIMGFDDLRRYCDLKNGAMPVYGSKETLDRIAGIFPYAFDPTKRVPGYVFVDVHAVDSTFPLGGLQITPFSLPHGRFLSTGYLLQRDGEKVFAYMNDCKDVPTPVRDAIRDVNCLMIDGLRDEPHPTHLNVSEAIAISRDVRAKHTYLTHLTHHKSHVQRESELPNGIQVAYDSLSFKL
jgi:phosphoribosyl 1,2-cyclic phosphate phosphodiesterase